MACYRPIRAWKNGNKIVFTEQADTGQPFELPCGHCIGCQEIRQREWALRCLHEAQMNKPNCFITLTYDDEHVPLGLQHQDWQVFIRAVRKQRERKQLNVATQRMKTVRPPIRYFMAGEYGSENLRPHFHALIFGTEFKETYQIGKNRYSSKELEKIWNKGYVNVGEINYTTAMYAAKYACKKITGDMAEYWYRRTDPRTGETVHVRPEYAKMSLKPGLGDSWIRKYHQEVYGPRDAIVLHGGREFPPPRFYDNKLKEINPKLLQRRQIERESRSHEFRHEQTPERLKAREACAKARQKLRKEQL